MPPALFLSLIRLAIPHGPGAVGQSRRGGIVDEVPHADNHRHQNHGVFHRFEQHPAKARPGGHIAPIETQVSQDRKKDRGGQIGPKHGVLDAYRPVDFHIIISFPTS